MSSSSRRTGVEQRMLAAKHAQRDLLRSKPWRPPKQSYLIDAVHAELLSGHELLYAP